jgi:hypothetical protein
MENYHSDSITELSKAMLKVAGELQPALKDRENPFTKSSYATLNSVMEACRESLVRHGIWLVQHPVPVEPGNLGLVTKLVHAESGQWQAGLLVMPLPKADPQGYGSALTYGRRYALSALVGIVAEEDDDGNAASSGKVQRKQSAAITQKRTLKAPNQDSLNEPDPGNPLPPAHRQADASGILSAMPRLDGINYEVVQATDGKLCILATGDTRSKKQLLAQAGFRWSQERQTWWKYADAA